MLRKCLSHMRIADCSAPCLAHPDIRTSHMVQVRTRRLVCSLCDALSTFNNFKARSSTIVPSSPGTPPPSPPGFPHTPVGYGISPELTYSWHGSDLASRVTHT